MWQSLVVGISKWYDSEVGLERVVESPFVNVSVRRTKRDPVRFEKVGNRTRQGGGGLCRRQVPLRSIEGPVVKQTECLVGLVVESTGCQVKREARSLCVSGSEWAHVGVRAHNKMVSCPLHLFPHSSLLTLVRGRRSSWSRTRVLASGEMKWDGSVADELL